MTNIRKESQEADIDLVDYIKVLYKRWKIIFALVFVSMLVSMVIGVQSPKLYESTAEFFPLNVSYSLQSEDVTMKPNVNLESLIVSILESQQMADRVIEQLDLKKLWGRKYMYQARNDLEARTKVVLGRKAIIRLSVRTTNAKLSANIANSFVDNLEYFNRHLDLGAQKEIVQVIDKPTVPERTVPRKTAIIRATILAGLITFIFISFLAFILEYFEKSNLLKRIKE